MPGLWDFAGLWRIDRMVENSAGPDARFAGQVRFTAGDGGLWQAEDGVMRMAGQQMRATRRYHWRAQAGLIRVDFADGRFFHAFDPAQDHPTAHHDCPPDSYAVTYDLSAWPEWRVTWRVHGPRKAYCMSSHLLPVASNACQGATAGAEIGVNNSSEQEEGQ
ncbi:DUF6314 family protein [Pseudooceanicola aestuarii]|uniref:DUF6314 family protein n=1 Tax=Pseudooceanicola aestuarii TaxID=2697319 RepID=UPI0013D710C4|nr:DUF6314 family protein [Pseudooceanicola aestuarii]